MRSLLTRIARGRYPSGQAGRMSASAPQPASHGPDGAEGTVNIRARGGDGGQCPLPHRPGAPLASSMRSPPLPGAWQPCSPALGPRQEPQPQPWGCPDGGLIAQPLAAPPPHPRPGPTPGPRVLASWGSRQEKERSPAPRPQLLPSHDPGVEIPPVDAPAVSQEENAGLPPTSVPGTAGRAAERWSLYIQCPEIT